MPVSMTEMESPALPPALREALEKEIGSRREGELAKAAAELSRRYRLESPGAKGRYLTTAGEVLAYAAVRMPATYAAVFSVLSEIKARCPGFQPRTLLDVGAGPGTAAWAAAVHWPELERCVLIEREPEMIALGRRVAAHAPLLALREATWLRHDLSASLEMPQADLVIASYVAGELSEKDLAAFGERLWESAKEILVLIEPGSAAGFERVVALRSRLVQGGAHVVAPCPHADACPLSGDWCHFGARVERTRWHRRLKGGELPYEDEKFSYVALSRWPCQPALGRVIRRPEARKGHVRLLLCTPAGVGERVISRKEGERFRWARKAQWGSPLPDEGDRR